MNQPLTFALQALLERHEHYMADAERERAKMTAKIEQLEVDKKELEVKNEKTIEENKGLLDQLEGMHSSFEESELQIKLLETTLQSTRTEMKRLETLASRTNQLEKELAILEEEQEALRKTITVTTAQERTAVLRWKRAERGLCDLQDQLERIEREAQEERERHVEILGRIERQRTVERELDTAAGRLKGATAMTAGRSKQGTSVVSHFVKDILKDNANLQLGIVELREMLMNSNDEVQILREQLSMHQPMCADNAKSESHQRTLGAELAPSEQESESRSQEPQVVSQTLHIHHHYHAQKKEEARKLKKKRTSLNSSIFSPLTRSPQSPRASRASENVILSQTAVTVPSPIKTSHRWSVQSSQLSEFAPSSVPSSPQSMYRNSPLFDRNLDPDSSRPTSPTSSIDPSSPRIRPSYHRKRPSEVSTRSFAAMTNFQPHHIIHEEEDDDSQDVSCLQITEVPSLVEDSTNPTSSELSDNMVEEWIPPQFDHRLHRSSSYESIVSISGIDIHTLKARPSQINMASARAIMRPRYGLSNPIQAYFTETITSASMITAQPILSRTGQSSTSYLRSNIGFTNSTRSLLSSDQSSIRSSSSNEGNNNSHGLGKKVGGWVFGRWRLSPAKSANDLRGTCEAQNMIPPPTVRAVSTPSIPITPDPMRRMGGRAAGINQKGPIPGFRQTEKAPCKVIPDTVDHDALAEVLEE
ncbi:hypothetical protein DSL72_002521 [Monilinia vaccinii-corymbosi]|uniref:Uncharacterized protein n=1 Tax=Monilinia vaccinii-corymbosi TaxID=61207 RepID=A0A8A3PCX2_9HELO|nr:hypothetical protein DSL72_002521 [Monilinia vaccinii-corymbosi]